MNFKRSLVTNLVLAMLALEASADEIYWDNPAGGVFQDGINWAGGNPPGIRNDAIFDLSSIGGYTVTFVTDDVAQSTVVRNDVVMLDLGGNTYTMSVNNPTSLVVGQSDGDNGLLTLINGQLITIDTIIGFESNAEGSIVMSGPEASWTNIESIIVGKSGIGSLAVLDGASVFSVKKASALGTESGSVGTGTVSGDGSFWGTDSTFRVGINQGNGSMLVQDGGAASSLGPTLIGDQGGNGEVTVTGLGSSWTVVNSGFVVGGYEGNGRLTIMDGATAFVDLESSIGEGNNAIGEIIVTGSGSNLTNQVRIDIGKTTTSQGTLSVTEDATVLIDGFAVVGLFGNATLEISSGGCVSSTAQTFVADQSASNSVLSILNPGSSLNVGGLFILGNHGHCVLTVTDGGAVNVGGISDMAAGPTAVVNATIAGIGSIWTSGDDLLVGSSGHATLLIKDFGIVIAESVSVGTSGLVTGNSVLFGNVQNSGGFSPGVAKCTSGVFTINGNYEQEQSGELNIEIGGMVSAQEYDVLAITGESVLNGTLKLSLFGGFLPQAGQQFDILTANSVTGTFSQIVMPISGQYEVSYDSNSVMITVTQSAVLGDLDGDEYVSTIDLLMLLANWGPCDVCCPADINGDWTVDEADLAILLDAWSNVG